MRKCYLLFYSGNSKCFQSFRYKAPAILFLFIFLFSFQDSNAQPGNQWEFSRDITLSAPTPLADFQIKIELNGAAAHAHMKVDGGDLRFYAGAVECSYWIERFNPTGLSVIWVKIPAQATSVLSMYYGNLSATTTSNGYNTFDFFDGFDGNTLNAAIWTNNSSEVQPGTISVAGGEVNLANKGNITSMYAHYDTASLPDSYIIELKHKETGYYRNRYYITDLIRNDYKSIVGTDYGLWSNDMYGNNTGYVQWGGGAMYADTNYLMRWDIIRTTGYYEWSNYDYRTGNQISAADRIYPGVSFIHVSVTEETYNSIIIDWARIRKAGTSVVTGMGTEIVRVSHPAISSVSTNSGCEGETFTIYGSFQTNFGRIVKIGTEELEIVSENNSVITAKFGTVSGNLSVTTSAGVSIQVFAMTATALPVITAGNALPFICSQGTSVALGGTVTGGTAIWSVNVTGGTFNVPGNFTTTTWTAPAGFSGTATFTLTGTQGSCAATATKTLVVHATPIGIVTVSGDREFCVGESVTFTAPSGYTDYQYLITNGAVITTINNGANPVYSATNLQAGASVKVNITNNGCVAILNTEPFTVNVIPSGTFITSDASGNKPNDSTICKGEIINFSFSNASFLKYAFILNGTDTLQNTSASYLSNITHLKNNDKITLLVTGTGGCSKLFGPIIIAVKDNPVGSLTSNIPGDAICLGSNLLFSASSGFVNYEFLLNGDLTLQGPSSSRTYTSGTGLINNDEVSVRVKDLNGCFANIDTVKVTVNPLPAKPTILTGGQPTTFCKGDDRNIELSVNVPGHPNYTYQWYKGTATYGSNSPTLLLTVPSESGNFSVRFVDENGCLSPQSDAVSITINEVAAKPIVTASGVREFCEGGSVVLTSSVATTYQWYYGATAAVLNPITGKTSQTLTITDVAQTGFYAVDVININGCAGAALSSALLVNVNALPATPVISVTAGDLDLCEGETVTFNAPASASYKWYKNGNAIAGATNQSYTTGNTILAAGEYTLEVTNAKGCLSARSSGETVVVNPLPIPSIIGPPTICLGTSGNQYSTEAGMNNYIWTAAGGGTITPGTGPNVILVAWDNSPGAKTLNVKYTDIKGCTSNKKATFTNSPAVIPTIKGLQQICVGSVNVEYKTEPGKTDYEWNISAGGSITSDNDSIILVTWSGTGAQTISVNYTNADNCNAPAPTVRQVTVNLVPVAEFSYSATPYCSSVGIVSPSMATGATKGVFSFSPIGLNLNINTVTGVINTSSSDPGTYTITNTIAAAGGCSIVTSTAGIIITELPTATIGYAGSPFCTSDNTLKTVTINGSGVFTGGIFTAPVGLSLVPGTGAINPSLSTEGNYKVTYSIPATAGCPAVVVTTATSSPVVITGLPSVSLSYVNSVFCKSDVGTKTSSLIGSTGNYSGGIYSVLPAGLNINTSTGSFSPAGSTAGNYRVTYTTPASAGCAAVSKTFDITITAMPTALIAYSNSPVCNTETSLPVTLTGTGAYTGGIYTVLPAGLSINAGGIINPSLSTPGNYTITYTIPTSGGCAAVPVTTSVTISPKPQVNAGTDWVTCVGEGPVNITQGADTSFAGSILWTGGTGTWAQATTLTLATYHPAPGETGEITLTLTATGRNGCSANSAVATKKLIINSIPAPVYIVPENAPALCVGGIQSFISVKNNVSDFTLGPLTSSTSSLNIPDNSTAGVSKFINVSGIPADAVITSVDIHFNIPHTYNGDLTINLKAANNKVLNIGNSLSGPGFINTTISSTSTNLIQTSGDIGPYTGTYAAQMRYGTQGATSVSGNRAFARSFDELFGNPNGVWILSVRDGGAGDYGNFESWSITIKYSTPNNPIPVLWRTTPGNTIPDNLYLDASATIPYTGDAQTVVYAKPTDVGAYNYTATSINQEGCKASKDISLNISPSPKVYIKADYCENAADGKITLYAMGVDNPASYNWSTGQTTSSVLVDIAHEYYVSVTNIEGCTGTGILSVAEELVVNGDFEQGNNSFYTEYVHMPSPDPQHPFPPVYTGLVNEGTYAVDTSAYVYHQQFHGRDHTTSEQKGKFLIINGEADLISTLKYPASHTRIIWEQTVSVLPNTDYYFSAWAMSFSGIGSTTRLQFEVNGLPVGTVAKLSEVSAPTIEENINISNWVRFYNGNSNGIDDTWNSGENTEAVIRIINLSNVQSGNDFGLDDISFGTLAPFVSGPDVSGRNEQTICVGESIQPIVYKVGSGDEPIDGLPAVFDNDFDGLNYTISGGSLAIPGVYEYVLQTTGSCPIPATATGKITVLENSNIVLTTGQPDATLCLNSNLPSPINFMISGTASGTEFIGLPAGMSGVYNVNTGEASISGSANVAGIFNYKVRTNSICKKDSLDGIITIDELPVAGTISSPAVCLNDNGVIKVTGYNGEILGWSISEDGTNYTPIASNTTDMVAFTNITQNTYYKVQVGNGVCPAVYSEAVAVSVQNLWQGKLSSAWDNPFNWASGSIPGINTSVCGGTITIPKVANLNHDPILIVSAPVTNLSVLSGGNLTINAGGNLQIGGTITNAGVINARNGGVEYVGNTTRSIEPDIFLNNNLGDLKINNKNKEVILNTPLNVYRSVSFGSNPQTLITNDQLTLKSTREATAWLGNMTGQTINGKATVERFINTGTAAQGGHDKSWQLLAIPTTGQTIKESWMEGATATNISAPSGGPGNPNPGYGTMLTGRLANAVAEGFDVRTSAGASIKYYNATSGLYDEPNSTFNQIYDPRGYMVLIRGDRSVFTSSGQATPTTLRTKGQFITGPQTIAIPANSFGSVGNPYASAVAIKDIIKTEGVNEFIYVWDPLLSGSYGLGGIATLTKTGDHYIATPASGSYPGQIRYIQSGQAFFVQTTGSAGTVQFTEAAKATGSEMVMRPFGNISKTIQLRTNLYGLEKNGSAFMSDGILLEFSEDFKNEIDGMDARKMSNTSENLAININGKFLAVERRELLMASDTIFFNLTGVRVQDYRFEFIATGLQQEGFIEDTFLDTKKPLNPEGSTILNFKIENIPGSYAPDRFRIVFKTALGPLPVTFVEVKAREVEEGILVRWDVENQSSLKGYNIEKSTDGISFRTIMHIVSENKKEYKWQDKNAQPGYNYYRINAVDLDGKSSLSNTVKVLIQENSSIITVYPNPITNGVVNVHLINQPSGKYKIRLLNPVGQVIINKIVTHEQGNSIHPIKWDYNMARGMYQVEVTKADGGVNLIKIIY